MDATAILAGIALAVAGFFVVVLVAVLVLRLLGVVLGEDDGQEAPDAEGIGAAASDASDQDAGEASGSGEPAS